MIPHFHRGLNLGPLRLWGTIHFDTFFITFFTYTYFANNGSEAKTKHLEHMFMHHFLHDFVNPIKS